ncbi:transcriptional regulator [Opitutaceae bacterium TAV1]|nr:transcriptional regulator [Opitutaceae bacterium TAV1]
MITIQEIAREARVSTATVSRVFSNHPNVKAGIRERVLQVARSRDYHPRLSGRRRNVMLITPSRSAYPVQNYVEMVISHIAGELAARGYRIEILPADNLDRLENIPFCGAIRIGSDEVPWNNWNARFDAPLVMIDREVTPPLPNVFSVRSNEKQGMELAVEYLFRRGHRRIGCLVSMSKLGNPLQRERYLEEALAERKLPAGKSLVRLPTEENFVEEVGKLLRNKPDAIFSPGGSGGIITAYALSLYGKRVPDDISLVVSERAMISRYCIPPQTAITQDYHALAAAAVDVIDARLRRQDFPRETVLDYQLIERDSVADRPTA